MALMDRPEENNEKLTEEQKAIRVVQHRMSWSQREKNYLEGMSHMAQAEYYSYKRKVADINREQLLMLHEEMYLFSKRQDSFIKDLAKKVMLNL